MFYRKNVYQVCICKSMKYLKKLKFDGENKMEHYFIHTSSLEPVYKHDKMQVFKVLVPIGKNCFSCQIIDNIRLHRFNLSKA